MNITFDPENDSLYIQLSDASFSSNKCLNDRFILDMDENGDVIGIEMLDVSDWVSDPASIKFEKLLRDVAEPGSSIV